MCFTCKDSGLFPFCEKCLRRPSDPPARPVKKKAKKKEAPTPYDDLPKHERDRRIAQDKYKKKTDEEDLTRLHRNLVKVGMSETGVMAIDLKLFEMFGPPSTWNYKVPRNPK